LAVNDESLNFRLRRRIFWYCWKQFGDKYNSFSEFKLSWDSTKSIKGDIKKDLVSFKNKVLGSNG
jgi:hypothetical protein